MTFCVQSFLLGVLCISLVLVSGFDTSLDLEGQTIEPTKKPSCFIGKPGPPQSCCFEECTPNCASDCIANGFVGGRCANGPTVLCCCLKP
ncbi:LCR [Medicago truncatula]|uniref:LCR n=1 Tax=Medicago truncatula TaxID=3880 RepID=A0A072UU12_MEDTR|nr:LCR [Medicago truncatula]